MKTCYYVHVSDLLSMVESFANYETLADEDHLSARYDWALYRDSPIRWFWSLPESSTPDKFIERILVYFTEL